ncbi:ABC transporter substrate-binding protein [Alcaligenes faecalis]|jgi:branched-chain amino acid transport system substrate-binding protein|uniref:ABC transporter substrate-binding protein n=1 Tax=Alcaligenes faecalis TaxID=511 RepID=UPI0005F8E57A|nr:ABC transporter substrate-binding protein [Alcaligenes faecalis]ALO37528.1 ABC transporter substrate-binding protein [Alcaligenes faecalis]KAA1285798.1 ABC transporter substrate-binding protein [Alcaligenes faecalis]MBH0309828.1 ABC transporter substrate-binding protein [Alcaligenes faecalis]MBW4790565.1 ABC transporter substrate-binding protein [Alcaligenes faecalis subsp. faecalis]OSZ37688.1 ABC transporter substrate-binding protein [Alcaligenes faecalis]
MSILSATPRKLTLALTLATAGIMASTTATADDVKPIKIGVVTFLSGAASGPFGVPAKNAAELTAAQLNEGKVPAPYNTKGLGGAPIELVFIDENGGTAKQVSEYRNLVQQQNVDIVVGYISSGDCLAVAPVAEELKKLTLIFDCGTPRLFEDASYKYVFRPVAHATMDNVAAARFVLERNPELKSYAGINQNYAWGQDAWHDFEGTLQALKPGVEAKTSQMPKLGAGQYNAEISSLMAARPEVIHSSFWGGDLEGFVVQALPRGLFRNTLTVLTAGETATHRANNQIPTGTIIGARGPHAAFAPDNELNRWLRASYREQFNADPSYPSYKMTQTLLGLKAAYEKAQAANEGKAPSTEQVVSAFEHLTFESPSGDVTMSLGKGHQAVQGTTLGVVKNDKGVISYTDLRHFKPEEVTPPEGVKSIDWIKGGLKH